MEQTTFELRLSSAKTPEELALLANDVIEDTLCLKPDCAEPAALPARMDMLLERGFDPNITADGVDCIFDLQYGYTDYHLEAARRIFEKRGLPTATDGDGLSFFSWIRGDLDYDHYNCDYTVKLYLLCAAYASEETYLKMREDLYPEMFDPKHRYTSKDCLSGDSVPLKLTPSIFKQIEKFDYCVEMLEQEDHTYGCWKLHIFDKKSKIEVAVYR